jgi:hypothetical protein
MAKKSYLEILKEQVIGKANNDLITETEEVKPRTSANAIIEGYYTHDDSHMIEIREDEDPDFKDGEEPAGDHDDVGVEGSDSNEPVEEINAADAAYYLNKGVKGVAKAGSAIKGVVKSALEKRKANTIGKAMAAAKKEGEAKAKTDPKYASTPQPKIDRVTAARKKADEEIAKHFTHEAEEYSKINDHGSDAPGNEKFVIDNKPAGIADGEEVKGPNPEEGHEDQSVSEAWAELGEFIYMVESIEDSLNELDEISTHKQSLQEGTVLYNSITESLYGLIDEISQIVTIGSEKTKAFSELVLTESDNQDLIDLEEGWKSATDTAVYHAARAGKKIADVARSAGTKVKSGYQRVAKWAGESKVGKKAKELAGSTKKKMGDIWGKAKSAYHKKVEQGRLQANQRKIDRFGKSQEKAENKAEKAEKKEAAGQVKRAVKQSKTAPAAKVPKEHEDEVGDVSFGESVQQESLSRTASFVVNKAKEAAKKAKEGLKAKYARGEDANKGKVLKKIQSKAPTSRTQGHEEEIGDMDQLSDSYKAPSDAKVLAEMIVKMAEDMNSKE